MLKSECLDRAAKCAHECKVISERIVLYTVTFGGSDPLTQKAMLERDVAYEACERWKRLANVHPKARAAMVRRGQIPAWMFYG